jgi:bis(5'-nucleosidyl)-tetraphosphatase
MMMKREKSCGALVVRKNGESYDLVLLRHRFGGHWSFPKGHVEEGESERQTALREVHEETGLSIRLYDGFRESVEYFPKPGVKKQVVYFLGEALGDELVRQEEEISELKWASIADADTMVTFANDKRLIRLAKKRLGLPVEAAAPRKTGRRQPGAK